MDSAHVLMILNASSAHFHLTGPAQISVLREETLLL